MGAMFRRPSLPVNPNQYKPPCPLDDLLRTIRLTGVVQASVRNTAPWATRMPRQADVMVLYVIVKGNCVAYAGDDVQHLSAGDVLLMPTPHEHVLADSLETTPVAFDRIVPKEIKAAPSPNSLLASMFGTRIEYGGPGRATSRITLSCYIDPRYPGAARHGLPVFVHIPGFHNRHRDFLDRIFEQIIENGTEGFEGQAVATRLAESILTLCIKEYLETRVGQNTGAMQGMSDPMVSKALAAIYENPQQDWHIPLLAKKAGLSRAAFTKRFKQVTGHTPHSFLTELRMSIACEFLKTSHRSIGQIAHEVGYKSEASFSRAFSRWAGHTPGLLRRGRGDVPGGEAV